LAGLVTSLRSTPAPEARPEFVPDLRTRLLLAAETALAPDTSQQLASRRAPAQRRTSRERRLAVAVGGFALVSASASMSVAAQTALPGDTLYPLKRALEDIHENALRDADDKGTTMLDNASGRLAEVDELSRGGGRDADVIAQTLEDFSEQAVEASDVLIGDFEETGRLSSIEELRSFTASSLEALQRLESLVPMEVRGSLVEAVRVLDQIEKQALSICPACGSTPLGDAVRAADVGEIYEQLLDAAPTQAAPTEQPTTGPKPRTKPSTSGQPAPVGTPTEQPSAQPDQPSLPQPPDGGGAPTAPDNPLAPLVTGLGNGDVLGDLLTGTVDAVDGLLGGGGGGKDDKNK
ncbi:DUF5667 domain-containing protein, partial [Nocardioides sp.]|uniref:DUF5667 domain-containing protein n=1 Tax=Nocardioides sp. TaxID=35761 RepID=UPI002725F478